jgi:hypothetical protein
MRGRKPDGPRGNGELSRKEVALRLGTTVGGLTYLIAARGLVEHRDEQERPYYRQDEVEAWILANTWTGPRVHKPLVRCSEQRAIRKGVYIARAMAMIADGKERVEIIIDLKCPADWIDEAYAEYTHSFESAAERRAQTMKVLETERERKEADRAQRSLEKSIRDELRKRRGKKT